MDNDSSAEAPVPGVYLGSEDERGTWLQTLEVDGEVFAVSARGGGTDYDWVSGPNQGYGFSSSGSPHRPEVEHRRSIRDFLDMIDPTTGYIAED